MFASILKLTRAEHSVMLIVALLSAEIISGGLPGLWTLVLSLATAVFLSMSAFAINDYFDIRVDRANKKNRPLVTGDLTPGMALFVAASCMLIGIAASIFINAYCIVIAVIFGVLSIMYSYRLKELPLLGNAYVAFAMAIPFIFGNYVVTPLVGAPILLIFSLVFLAGLAREMDGTVRDYSGDLRRRAVTLPRVIGARNTAFVGFVLYIMAIALSAYLFMHVRPFEGNLVYLGLIAISDIMLLYSGVVYALGMRKRYDTVRNVSLGGMALALLCILISALVYI
jgi:geranylgeranylglycerol-phosphate geranylgeranyltransferase